MYEKLNAIVETTLPDCIKIHCEINIINGLSLQKIQLNTKQPMY